MFRGAGERRGLGDSPEVVGNLRGDKALDLGEALLSRSLEGRFPLLAFGFRTRRDVRHSHGVVLVELGLDDGRVVRPEPGQDTLRVMVSHLWSPIRSRS